MYSTWQVPLACQQQPLGVIEVMNDGKLVETGYDTASVQVVIAQSEEGEQL